MQGCHAVLVGNIFVSARLQKGFDVLHVPISCCPRKEEECWCLSMFVLNVWVGTRIKKDLDNTCAVPLSCQTKGGVLLHAILSILVCASLEKYANNVLSILVCAIPRCFMQRCAPVMIRRPSSCAGLEQGARCRYAAKSGSLVQRCASFIVESSGTGPCRNQALHHLPPT